MSVNDDTNGEFNHRFNPQIPEIPEGGNDYNDPSLLPLNK